PGIRTHLPRQRHHPDAQR
ncbi:hypothetical protein BN1708_018999, partial [Verticillium longisporum]